jgi:hypothetical protein
MEYYSAIKKNEIMPFAGTWMELEIIMLSEISQAQKDKYLLLSVICRIYSLKMNDKSLKWGLFGVDTSGRGKDKREGKYGLYP